MYQCREELLSKYEQEVKSDNLSDTLNSDTLNDFQSDIIQLDGNDSVIAETEINSDKSNRQSNWISNISLSMTDKEKIGKT